MTMPWDCYLVYQHKDICHQDERMALFERYEVIMEGFAIPQMERMAGYGTRRYNRHVMHNLMTSFAPVVRGMAETSHKHQDPCEKPIMMWSRICDLARDTLTEFPDKDQIERLRDRCDNMYETNPRIDSHTRKELDRTIYILDTVLDQWDLTEKYPLRFYPHKPEHFTLFDLKEPRAFQHLIHQHR